MKLSDNTVKYICQYDSYLLRLQYRRAIDEYDLDMLQKCIDADTTPRTFQRETYDWYEEVKVDYSRIDIAAAREELIKFKHELSFKLQRKREREAERLNLKRLDSIEHDMIERKEADEIIIKYGCPIFQKTRIKICKWSNTEHTRYWPKLSYYIKPFSVDGKYSKQDILNSLKETV
nr:MAG TPA: hypothetical protein [Caudoviricetes sp.]